jgi:hypothetical protein
MPVIVCNGSANTAFSETTDRLDGTMLGGGRETVRKIGVDNDNPQDGGYVSTSRSAYTNDLVE